MFRYLAALTPNHTLCWDCATGNGQAATALTEYFNRVVATDASEAQIEAAVPDSNVEFAVATAESSGLRASSVDLLTVGQAFHWFDEQAFFAEAKRVLKTDGVLAIWCYGICAVDPVCDAIIDKLYRDIIGDYWPPERDLIEQGYAGVTLPGEPVSTPPFDMSLGWQVDDMLGYLRTWSACKRYEEAQGSDPVAQVEAALVDAWGPGMRDVVWPLTLKVSRANSLLE